MKMFKTYLVNLNMFLKLKIDVKYVNKIFLSLEKVKFLSFFGIFLQKNEINLISGNHNFLAIFFINYVSNMKIIVSHFKILMKVKKIRLPNNPKACLEW